MASLSDIRKEYTKQTLDESSVLKHPIDQLEKWLNEAIEAQVSEPTAMTLATCTINGKPSARIVLLKNLSKKGLVFFTNYESHKANDIQQNPYAAAVLLWADLERQVRVEGFVEKVTSEDSDSYFESRPQHSKLGAWASPQSKVIPNREYLEQLMANFEKEFENKEIKRPSSWGEYIIKPTLIEFWQGRASRLHDRIQYRQIDTEEWVIERLAP